MTKVKKIDYAQLSQELEAIIQSLQSGELELEEAMVRYKRGAEVIRLMQAYLKNARSSIQKIQIESQNERE